VGGELSSGDQRKKKKKIKVMRVQNKTKQNKKGTLATKIRVAR
jgi:hypothetical protein